MKHTACNKLMGGSTTAMALVISLLLLVGCGSAPVSSDGAVKARSDLTALQKDPNLGERVRREMSEAEQAVKLAEEPLPKDSARLNEHRVYMANQKIGIARARAMASYDEDQRRHLGQARDDARLQSRTAEVDRAQRREADLQRQLTALQAETTDRGIVLTLGDVLFASGSAELQPAADGNLDRLANFLRQHPERQVLIEGHTDSTGNKASNQQLSQRRADSVSRYLVRRGIAADRLSTRGVGEERPVASNASALGRQQNRRVEVIIENSRGS
ncbi:OmpA family protein [Marinospirillum alkaliphilum]|uniref:Outer membrane protein OmpA n=1 Tax=Marinospirillum alkaliphilum DSM 21637 TaxID=1122209 RepID=A0A1K1XE16_9GAMM|nr:OmpA family protein [Marinospirillum alkaliphilum]SFX47856.1 Outer membrane protein OmpA [Marinospirillum alkaliphilum DSM 21637]